MRRKITKRNHGDIGPGLQSKNPRASRTYREKRRVLRELGDGAERSREMQTH